MTYLAFLWAAVAVAAAQEPAPEAASKDETWRLRGRAVNEQGRGIEGACLLVAPEGNLTTARALEKPTTKAGTDGWFEVSWPDLPGDSWYKPPRVLITAEGRVSALLLPTFDRQVRITGEDLRRIEFGDVPLPPGVTRRGRVRREHAEPLGGACVRAQDVLEVLPTLPGITRPNISYVSLAHSNDNGAFTLPGVVSGGVAITVTAKGYYKRELPFVTERDPLDIELARGGFVDGLATDSDGHPLEASIWIEYEVGDGHYGSAGADGRFHLNLEYPHRYLLIGGPPSNADSARAFSPVFDGPRAGVELRVEREPDPDVGVTIRSLDAATKRPIEQFEAVAVWFDPETTSTWIGSRPGFDARRSNAGGTVRLPGPREHEPPKGTILVKAKGYATTRRDDVRWNAASPPELAVELVPESVLAGTVVDADTGNPVAGAFVLLDGGTTASPWFSDDCDAETACKTDDKGRFRLAGLGEGDHKVRVVHPVRPDSVESLTLGPAEQRTDIKLKVTTGATLSGRMRGAGPGTGRLLSLLSLDGYHYSTGSDNAVLGRYWTRIGSDGSFTIPNLEKGRYQVVLLLPQRNRRFLKLAVEEVHIGTHDLRQDVDVSAVLPGHIEGHVTVRGGLVPMERLLVELRTDCQNPFSVAGLLRNEARARVAPDGTFLLAAAEGVYHLRLIDLATGVVLLEPDDEILVESRKRVRTDLETEAVLVHVRLKPAVEGGEIVASRLEVIVEHDGEDDHRLSYEAGDTVDSGIGVSLADGRREVELLLPVVPTMLRVNSNIDAVRWCDWKPTVTRPFTPEPGKINRLEIVVPSPPAFDPADRR